MFLFIKEAKYLKDYKVELKFTNNKTGVADLKNELHGDMFMPLKDKKLFSTLKVDKDLDTVVWCNGADLAPEFLYFKSFQNEQSLQAQFKEWGYI